MNEEEQRKFANAMAHLNARGGYYILDPRTLKAHPCDWMTWALAFEETERRFLRTTFKVPTGDPCSVSTVFLGLDHNWGGGRPILWETMIFYEDYTGVAQWRYHTAVQAAKGHRFAVRIMRDILKRAGIEHAPHHTERFRTGA